MSRKNSSNLPALLSAAGKLPWWLGIILAVASGLYLHSVAIEPLPTYAGTRQLSLMLINTIFKSMATFGQFLVPMIFLGGALGSFLERRKRRKLLDSAATPGGNTLLSISWLEFELLVGEALRRQGFSVQEAGGAGPDGGIDLVARKDGEKYLVQCKQWRSVQVGVPVVRELYGAMAAEGAVGGFVISSGRFTKAAKEFASGRNLKLVDGDLLNRWIADAKRVVAPAPITEPVNPEPRVEPEVEVATPLKETPVEPEAPACPHCRKAMVMRVARTGANAGGSFWGCSAYPKCRGIRAIFAPMVVK
ncbi:restriction endonuclease [Pseudomonas sp. CFII64]|uniref:restriction endonuclease n=1 Tax=Pseudomonas sp. CFII64 TaxID=911242 RepID=UPI0003577974|nr:restriction endonuclease [Pseudomonas sp. CFII64]EPJ89850.1 restriction endonuclease [Pseudomonas sp. CFII64]